MGCSSTWSLFFDNFSGYCLFICEIDRIYISINSHIITGLRWSISFHLTPLQILSIFRKKECWENLYFGQIFNYGRYKQFSPCVSSNTILLPIAFPLKILSAIDLWATELLSSKLLFFDLQQLWAIANRTFRRRIHTVIILKTLFQSAIKIIYCNLYGAHVQFRCNCL